MLVLPEISVVTVVYNGMPYLPEAVESVLAQTFRDFEMLVIDDGSTDETPRYMASVADERVVYHRLPRVGLVEVRNYGLRIARAPLIAVLDADDCGYPSRLAEQRAYLARHDACAVVGSQADVIDHDGTQIGRWAYPLSDDAIRWRMLFGCPILQPSATYRRDAALRCGGYRKEFPNAEDYDLWTRIGDCGRLANDPQALIKYRVRPGSMTTSRQEEQTYYCGRIAAHCAAKLLPSVSEGAVVDLYNFLCSGRDPVHVDYLELAETYRRIKQAFRSTVGEPSEELIQWMSMVQRNLRWHCLERAEREWRRPWQAWNWLRLAGQFDPEDGTVGRIIARGVRKALRATGRA